MSDPESVQIRVARPADAELLAALGARTFEEAFGADNSPEDMATHLARYFTPATIEEELLNPSNRYLIAEIADSAAGYAKLRWGASRQGVQADRPVELSRIYVAAEWIGQRVGAALIQRCLDEAQASDADVLWLGVWERNERAISFYEKWGFAKVGEHVFVLGSDPQTDWLMARTVITVGVDGFERNSDNMTQD